MRVTDQMRYQLLKRQMGTQQESVVRSSEQLLTGRHAHRASQDPGSSGQLGEIAAQKARHEAYHEVGERLRGSLETADGALGQATHILSRAREIAMQSGSGTWKPSQLEAIADEVALMRQSLVDVGNTSFRGQHLFGGIQDDQPPFDAQGAFSGDIAVRRVAVAAYAEITQVSGAEAFGVGGTGVDSFAMLDDLEAALRAGDSQAIRDRIDEIDTGVEQVLSARQHVGHQLELLDQVASFAEEATIRLTQQDEELGGIDVAAVVTEMSQAQLSLQATVGVHARFEELSSLILRL